MKILVTGSMAYDTIMVFPDRFRNHLLPDQLHILNVCFLTPEMRREFGGTAGNIAYNLKLLGEDPLLMATVGEDIQPYLYRLERLGIGAGLLKQIAGQFTAQAFITTDLDDNQITAFHPGAMNHSHENQVDAKTGRGPGDRRAGRQGGHAAALAPVRRPRHPVPVRPGPGPADVLGRGTARDGAAGRLPGGERLRGQAAGGKDRAQPRGPGARAEGAHRHPGRAGLRDIRRRQAHRDSRRRAPRRSSIRPAAATPTAPACSTASRRAGTGRAPGAWVR